MKEYVLGFAYDDECVLLIRKNRPAWQDGYLNGIGGHIERGEMPHEAMAREFNEETMGKLGNTKPDQWNYVCTFRGEGYIVYTFGCPMVLDQIVETQGEILIDSDEGLITDVGFDYIREHPEQMISNLRWLIPMVTMGCRGTIGKTDIWENIPETQGVK